MSLLKKIKNWEQWPFKVLYAPISFVWLWYIIKSRAIWFFTPSNPKLTFGGMEGEPKKEMHELLPENFYPKYFNVTPSGSFNAVLENLMKFGINFPLIVKPEVGGQGILFRKINGAAHLKIYHERAGVEYFIQEFIDYPVEVSLFYYRYPSQPKGAITGFLQKIPLQVTGDGKHTLEELIMKNKKASNMISTLLVQHAAAVKNILPYGEKYMLSYAANHNRGAMFIDLKNQIDDKLVSLLDEISISINDFFYGRYDIMCTSVDDLKQRKNFMILEYNGCGAEPNHFYDTGYTLLQAWNEILKHWKILYRISRYNRKAGVAYWPAFKGFLFISKTRKYYKKIKDADKLIP